MSERRGRPCACRELPALGRARHARRIIEVWASRIQQLVADDAEPAWAEKVARLGANIARIAEREAAMGTKVADGSGEWS